nr:hypothetical protein [Maliibacterium massiliense]
MGETLSLARAKQINDAYVHEPHLIAHAIAVSSAMGAMAAHFGEDAEHWQAVGYLHDVDFEAHPEEHLQHARAILEAEQVDQADIRAILSHGWGICSDVMPQTNMEKSLFTVDELTGIIMAATRMRPNGIADLEVKSAMKKFKDKRFAAKCSRAVIQQGCDLLGMELRDVMALCIAGMKTQAEALGLLPNA